MAVDKIQRRWGDTYTHKALEFASNVMLTTEHGARVGVVKLMVVLTDGRSSRLSLTKKVSKAIHDKGEYLFYLLLTTIATKKYRNQ